MILVEVEAKMKESEQILSARRATYEDINKSLQAQQKAQLVR
jgi:hypothetical protein